MERFGIDTGVVKLLQDTYDLKAVTTPEEDLAAILSGKS